MSIDKAVKVSGLKYFSYLKDGKWVNDPLEPQAMFSRTFLPEGTQVKQFSTASDMVAEITTGSDIIIPDLPKTGKIKKDKLYMNSDTD